MLALLFKFLIGHFIGDVALQSEDLVKFKHTSLFFLTAHSFIYGGVIYLLINQNLFIGIIATISHWIIDWLKIHKFINLAQDQILHFSILIIGGLFI